MKIDKSLLTRKTDSYVTYARELSSRGMSFWIVLLGVILQASHTTLLMYHVSAFENTFLKGLVSLGIGIFVSMSLAIFTLKHDGVNKEIAHLINVFFYFEIFTNVFYYFNSIIFNKGFDNVVINDWLYLIASLPFAYIIPFAIKKFSNVIRADESLQFGSIDVIPTEAENVSPETLEEFKEFQTEKVNKVIEEVEKLREITDESVDKKFKELEKNIIKKGETISVTSETGKIGNLTINDSTVDNDKINNEINNEITENTENIDIV